MKIHPQPLPVVVSCLLLSLLMVLGACQTVPSHPTQDDIVQAPDAGDSQDDSLSSPFGWTTEMLFDLLDHTDSMSYRDQYLRSSDIFNLPKNWQGVVDGETSSSDLLELVEIAGVLFPTPSDALDRLRSIDPRSLDRSQQRVHALMLQIAYQSLNDCDSALHALTTYEPQSEVERRDWIQRILRLLSSTCVYQSASLSEMGRDQHWWNLSQTYLDANTRIERDNQLKDWNEDFPAVSTVLIDAFRNSTTKPVNSVALLLPQSGDLASAADAIRNGFLAAHMQTPTSSNLQITMYDTSTDDILELVDQAIAEGAEVIVGPLDKERVRQIMEGDPPPIPTVTLNQSSFQNSVSPNALQLALVIEDDIDLIVETLLKLNLVRVLLVLGNEYWNIRATQAFREKSEGLIDVVGESVLANQTTVTEQIGELLLVSDSTKRQDKIEASIRNSVDFVTRRRTDVDAIVALVGYDTFASMNAAVHYFFAGEIPVFAVETTFREIDRTNIYSENNLFTSIPAFTHSIPQFDELTPSFDDSQLFQPLYAFGIDAYRVAMNVHAILAGESCIGYTGLLKRLDDSTVKREPVLGRIVNQSPVPAMSLTPYEPLSKSLLP